VMIKATEPDVEHVALLKVLSAQIFYTPRLGDRMLLTTRVQRRSGPLVSIEGTATLDVTGRQVGEARLLEALMTKTRGLAGLFPTTGAVGAASAGGAAAGAVGNTLGAARV